MWQGFGFLVLFIPIACYAAMVAICRQVFGLADTNMHAWPGALGTALSAGLLCFLTKKLDRPGRLLVDPATGQRVTLKRRDTFFFIPLMYWSFGMLVIALGMLIFRKDSPL